MVDKVLDLVETALSLVVRNGSGTWGGRGGYGVTYSISGTATAYAAGDGGGNENT